MKRILLIALITTASLNAVFAQDGYDYSENMKLLYATVFDGDTIPQVSMEAISIVRYSFPNDTERLKYERTKAKVERVYPYYLIAKEVIEEMEDEKANARKREFKKYKKSRKKELMKEFEKELRLLKVSEGKILVKMINRNTGIAFYDLIKEYNTGAKAWIYNIAANKYGYDLKADYNPDDLENHYLEMALTALAPLYE